MKSNGSNKLGDLCEFINGGAWKQNEYVDGGIPVVQVSNIKDGNFDLTGQKYLQDSSFEKYKKHQIESGDLIIATVGSHATQASAAGRAVVANDVIAGMLLNQNAVLVRTNSKLLAQEFLGYLGKSPNFQTYIRNAGQGAANQVRIAISSIKGFKATLPAIDQQNRIASVLFAYDDLIENNRRRIQLLEESARLLYKEWFVRLRFPGHEHIKIVDGVPEGWERRTLGEVAATNVRSYTPKTLPERIFYVDISSVSTGQINGKKEMPSSEAPGRARRIAQSGDIIWSNVRPNLKAYALVLSPGELDVFSTGFTVITPLKVPFTFLYIATTTEDFVGYLVNHTTGASYPAVRADDFENAELLIPSASILETFQEKTVSMFDQIHVLEEQSKRLAQARDLLLPKLMNCEVAV